MISLRQSVGRLRSRRLGGRSLAVALVALSVVATGVTASPAVAAIPAGEVYGAIAIRNASDALVPGVEVLIRRGDCATGTPVWQNTTSNRKDAYGAFAFTLTPGEYCSTVLAVPVGVFTTPPQTFTVGTSGPAWKTTWLPIDPNYRPVTYHNGVVATRDAYSQALPGIGVRIHQNACTSSGANGPAVWDTVTPSRRDAYGAFGFTLAAGTYCVITSTVIAPYQLAQPATVVLGPGSPATTSVNLWLPGPAMPDFAVKLLSLTNATRAAAGKAPLTYSPSLSNIAQSWTNAMASKGDFSHNPVFSQQYPSGWGRAGENIAWRRPTDVEALHKQFVESPGHYRNIIGEFNYIGFGYVVNDSGAGYVTENFANYATNPG